MHYKRPFLELWRYRYRYGFHLRIELWCWCPGIYDGAAACGWRDRILSSRIPSPKPGKDKKIITKERRKIRGPYPPMSPYYPPYTLYTCIQVYLFRQGRGEQGRANQREGLRGACLHEGVENTNMTDCISSL